MLEGKAFNQTLKRLFLKLIGEKGKKLLLRILLIDEEKILLDFRREGFFVDTGWLKALAKGGPVNSNNEEIPWFTYPSVYFLDVRLENRFRVFEFGSGASTIYFQRKGMQVTSLEYDRNWYDKINALVVFPNKVFYQPYDDGTERYENFLSSLNEKFDLIVIDGRGRLKCCMNAINYLSNSGVIILDDSEREKYKLCFSLFESHGFRALDFWGISAGDYNLKCTTIFYRSDNVLGI